MPRVLYFVKSDEAHAVAAGPPVPTIAVIAAVGHPGAWEHLAVGRHAGHYRAHAATRASGLTDDFKFPPCFQKERNKGGNSNKRYFLMILEVNFRRLRRARNRFLPNTIIHRRRRRKFLGFGLLKSRFLKGKSMQNDVKY